MLKPKKTCVFLRAINVPIIAVVLFTFFFLAGCATAQIKPATNIPEYDVVIRSNDNNLIFMEKGYLNSENEGENWITLEEWKLQGSI